MSAQEETETVEAAAPVKKEKKPVVKKYPMKEISGQVVDAATGEGLSGVKVKSFNNSFYTAMTDSVGQYTISVPTFVTSLSAELEGYNIMQVAINERANGVDFQMFTNKYLGEYTGKLDAARSSATSNFEQTTAMTADQEVQNRLGSDVRSISRSGIPGTGVNMFIEGYHSLNSISQPLVVVDGVVYDMMYDAIMLHNGYFNNLLLGINMDDIEDVKVLKNGAAIYGAKAANGVIMITTKRNSSFATRIDLNINGSYELIPSTPDVMNADQYRSYASGLLKNTGTKLDDFKFLKTDPNYYYYNMYHNDTDWKDVAYREAFAQNYSLHINGGDDVANYNLSVGFMNAKSTLEKNDITRFNIRFNSDIVLTSDITTRFDVSYSNVKRNLRDDGFTTDYKNEAISSPGALVLVKSPFVAPYDFSTDGKMSSFVSDADNYLDETLGKSVAVANPLGILKYGEAINKNKVDNTFVNIAITPKWHIKTNMSLQEHFSYSSQTFDEAYYTPIIGMPRYTVENIGPVENTVGSNFSRHNAVQSDTRFDWAIPLGAHRIDAYAGVRYLNDSYRSSYLYAYSTTNDKTPQLSSNLDNKISEGSDLSWCSMSYYANVDYNFREKYYLQGSFSMETSSRFGKDADAGLHMFGVTWGFFPSLQGSWVLSNEDWFKTNNLVNQLKVNAGFEILGNDNYDNNAAYTYMSSNAFLLQKAVGIGITNIGNTKLRWETTKRFNVGLEGNFFNNRLNARFNFFHSKTDNLVTIGTLAYVAGLTDYWTNDGALKNTGFDLALTGKPVVEKNFKLELGASLGHYKNEVTKLPNGIDSYTTDMYRGTVLTKVGQPIGVFYGYQTNGVFATTQEAEKADLGILNEAGNKVNYGAGDMKFVDQNKDGLITDKDKVIIGDPNPDLYGNLFANLFIGQHWSLGFRFNYSLGNDIYNYERSILEGGHSFLNQTTALTRRWIAEGQVTDIPQAVFNDPMGNSVFSDRWIEDGSYLKLKNVTLSYQLPITNQYVQGLTIWAAGNNLITFSKYLGRDPEVSCSTSSLCQGIDAGYTPAGRSFTLGIKINL